MTRFVLFILLCFFRTVFDVICAWIFLSDELVCLLRGQRHRYSSVGWSSLNLTNSISSGFCRLQTHISILEQQQNHSQGYFSYEETPSLTEQQVGSAWATGVRISVFYRLVFHAEKHHRRCWCAGKASPVSADEYLHWSFASTIHCRKREYELQQLREQLNDSQHESEEKLRRTVEQVRSVLLVVHTSLPFFWSNSSWMTCRRRVRKWNQSVMIYAENFNTFKMKMSWCEPTWIVYRRISSIKNSNNRFKFSKINWNNRKKT